MLQPNQSLQVLVSWNDDLLTSFEASDLDGELYGNDNKKFHRVFDTKTSAMYSELTTMKRQPKNEMMQLKLFYLCQCWKARLKNAQWSR